MNTTKVFSLLTLCSALALGACQTSGTSSQKSQLQGFDMALNTAAQAAQDQGAQKESLLFYEELYRRNAGDPDATITFTRALRENGQFKKAEIILEAWAGKNNDVDLEYAKTLLALGQFHEAQSVALNVLEKDKNNAFAHHVIGVSLDALGQHEQAEEHLRTAYANWKGSPVPVLNNLALNLGTQYKRAEALGLIERALIYAPNDQYLQKNRELILAMKAEAPVPETKPAAGG